MNAAFTENWNFAESKMDDIKRILKSQAMHIISIEVASPEDDMKHSTDLKVKVTAGDVAVRIRRGRISFRDMTIRAKNGNAKTEIHKLREGFARWYLYMWADNSGKIDDWILVDIDKMRAAGLLNESRQVKMNKDGYTGFVTYTQFELKDCGALISWG
jgi:hypothetical protein